MIQTSQKYYTHNDEILTAIWLSFKTYNEKESNINIQRILDLHVPIFENYGTDVWNLITKLIIT